jgi:hypothetical protein
VKKIELMGCEFEIDTVKTKQHYENLPLNGTSADCSCVFCQNYAKAVLMPNALPMEVVELFNQANVDIQKASDLYCEQTHHYKEDFFILTYNATFQIAGKMEVKFPRTATRNMQRTSYRTGVYSKGDDSWCLVGLYKSSKSLGLIDVFMSVQLPSLLEEPTLKAQYINV